METFIFASGLILISIFILSIGVLFFGAEASRTSCGVIPEAKKASSPKGEQCATGEAGLCPFEDNTGALKMQMMTKINR